MERPRKRSCLHERPSPAPTHALWAQHGFWFPLEVRKTRITGIRSFEDPPLLVKERAYLARLSAFLSAPQWWHDAFEDHNAGQEDAPASAFLSQELRHIRDHRTVQRASMRFWPGTATGSFLSDDAIPTPLKHQLAATLGPLEANAVASQRWRFGYEAHVLDVVHPAHEPLVFGKTQYSLKRDAVCGDHIVYPPTPTRLYCNEVSLQYQWLPSEFSVSASGRVTVTSRIVGLDDHSATTAALASTFEHLVPMFEQTLAEMKRPTPMRLYGYVDLDPMSRLCNDDWLYYTQESDEDRLAFLQSSGTQDIEIGSERERRVRALYIRRLVESGEVALPDRDAFPPFESFLRCYDGFELARPTSLRDRTLLVYTKVVSIVLRPETPEFDGLPWQFDGIANEAVVATGVYCYSLCNIIPSPRIELRATFDIGRFEFDQDERRELYERYGIEHDVTYNLQSTGFMDLAEDRAVVFSNHMQHRLGKFSLAQPDAPGHCKLVIFSLVDPGTKVLSTVEIPSQCGSVLSLQIQRALPRRLPDPVLWKILAFAANILTEESLQTTQADAWRERTTAPVSEEIPYYCFPIDLKGEYVSDSDAREDY